MTSPKRSDRPLLTVRDLGVRFGDRNGGVTAVDGLSFELSTGRTLAIVGESGAGKTIACRALMGLLPESAVVSGSAKLDGAELLGVPEQQLRRHRGADIAMAFQDPARALNPTMRVGHQLAEALRAHASLDAGGARRRAVELLRLVRLGAAPDRYCAYAHELSGGMRQRVMLAIALACGPRLLIADEATRSLDAATQTQILGLLGDLQRRLGMAIIMITHDIRLAATFADDVLVMRAGRLVERARAARVLVSASAAYTRDLLDAAPSFDRARAERRPRKKLEAEPLLAARDVVQRYRMRAHGAGLSGHRTVAAVAGVSIDVGAGETLGLLGETGSGKSTLARALLQTPRPDSGSVRFLGRELTRLRGRELAGHRRRMQLVFQDPFVALDPAWRVASIVAEPLAAAGGASRAEHRRRVAEVLELVELPAATYGRRRPRELSGGQCQRVAIARALASEPALVICDEAVASLDAVTQAQTLRLLERLRADLGVSFLFISHDLAVIRQISDRVAVMYLGRLCEVGPTESILERPAHPYTAALVACAMRGAAAASVAGDVVHGEPASPMSVPSGCVFQPRCPRAAERCLLEAPQLRTVGGQRLAACHVPLAGDP